jgi:hypothetical protein
VLSGGYHETGSITFTLSDPSMAVVYTSVVAVNGNGTYDTSMGTSTGSAVPTVPGTYQWVASYSGDPNNNGFTTSAGGTPVVVLPPTVQFSTASQTVNASAGTFSVTVTQSATSGVNTTIPFTLGGTAVAGRDYGAVSASPLVIMAGQTTGTITGTLLADPGPNQTLTFTLGTPTNATLGSTTSSTLTITEPTPIPTSGIGAFDSASGTWYLRNERSAGAPDAGQFAYGVPGWEGVVGDWNGDGTSTVGVVNPQAQFAQWYLRNENSAGAPDVATPFFFGFSNWIPLAGDWTGTGHTGIGMYDPVSFTWYLENVPGSGKVDFQFQYGFPGWIPVVGDWNHSGHDGIGLYDPVNVTWYLRNEVSAGAPDAGQFAYGFPGWLPLAGDWNGDGQTTIGLFAPDTATWYLRNENNAGAPDAGQFPYGFATWKPVAGAWTGQAASKAFPTVAVGQVPDTLADSTLINALHRRESQVSTWAIDQVFSAGL